jgi:RNA-binding protein
VLYNPSMSDRPAEDRTALPVPALSSEERRALRARAHALDPVVMIGDAGLTEAVVAETDRALAAHGLVKVRVSGDDRAAREAAGSDLERRLGCARVQSIGKVLVLWRPGSRADEPSGAARPTPRRRAATVPKKLAALGKTPKRRARPAAPPPSEPARGAAPGRRRAGPGLRDARGAFDAGARPGASPGARTGERPGGRPPERGTGRTGTTVSAPSPARPAAARTRAATAGPSGRAAPGPKPAPRGTAARPGPGPAGTRGPEFGGTGRRTAESAGPGAKRRPAGAAQAGAKARSRAEQPSAARPSGTGARKGTRRGPGGGTPATGSARPGPRTRAGRRGP